MKRKLLSLAMALIVVMGLNAQKVWNFGADATTFPLSTGVGMGPFPVIIDGLSITGISTNANMGAITAGAKTFTDANNVSYSFANRFQFNGAGYTGAAATDVTPSVNMPTQRYISFNVSGNSKIYFIGITGSSSSARKIFVTDGTTYVGGLNFPAASVANDGTIDYTGPAATLYIFCNQSCNLYYLSATNVLTTGIKSTLSDKGVTFNGTELVNNLGAELEVYNVVGKKITSSITTISTSNFPKGIYMARIKGHKEVLKFKL
ncbi:MAG: T9SS type A sorting domain-containing protein [Bacteroidales bacterium]|nr:T9SS type A sorting domain-containing protein [Bacteroidales bacterium]